MIRNGKVRRLGDTVDCSTVMSYINPITNAQCLFGSSGASTATDPEAITVSGLATDVGATVAAAAQGVVGGAVEGAVGALAPVSIITIAGLLIGYLFLGGRR